MVLQNKEENLDFLKRYPNENFFNSKNWADLISIVCDCEYEFRTIGNKDADHIQYIIYLKNSKIITTPNATYDGFKFQASNSTQNYKVQRQWIELAKNFASEMQRMEIKNWTLPPAVKDVRPFMWSNYKSQVAYTFTINLKDQFNFSHAVRKRIAKSFNDGFTCSVDGNLNGLLSCIMSTEIRQKIKILDKRLTYEKLNMALKTIGENKIRVYSCYTREGEIASSRIVLWSGGKIAHDWLAGTSEKYLSTGVNQLLINYVLSDLKMNGCEIFDFGGANVQNIQAYKSEFSGELVSYFQITPNTLSNLKQDCYKFLKNKLNQYYQR